MPTGVGFDAFLRREVDSLWTASIAPSTMSAYQSGLQCFVTFLTMSGFICQYDNLPHISEDILIFFVTHCHAALRLHWSTIKIYLAGVRYHYLKAGFQNPLYQTVRLQCILRGIRKQQNPVQKPRLPITFSLLFQICSMLQQGVFSPHIDSTLRCMCTLAFFGFLRCGEFTVKNCSHGVVVTALQVCHVRFSPDKSMFVLTLPASKTDPFRLGVDIPIYANNTLCPVHCMDIHLGMLKSRVPHVNASHPLFIDGNGQAFSRDLFISYLRQLLCRLGLQDQLYSGHSFRIGAATSAAAAGIDDHLIQTLGRWSSKCYTRYIQVAPTTIETAQLRMCHS